MLDKLRNKCDELLSKNQNNKEEHRKYILIKNILNNDNCFFEIDIDTAISILNDLEFDTTTAKKIYLSLINEENL